MLACAAEFSNGPVFMWQYIAITQPLSVSTLVQNHMRLSVSCFGCFLFLVYDCTHLLYLVLDTWNVSQCVSLVISKLFIRIASLTSTRGKEP